MKRKSSFMKAIIVVAIALILSVGVSIAQQTTTDTATCPTCGEEYIGEYATLQEAIDEFAPVVKQTFVGEVLSGNFDAFVQLDELNDLITAPTGGEESFYVCMIACMTAIGITAGAAALALLHFLSGVSFGEALALAMIAVIFFSGAYGCLNMCGGGGGGGSFQSTFAIIDHVYARDLII